MTFHVGKRAAYPANWRWCVKCKTWKDNNGGRFRPFIYRGCLNPQTKNPGSTPGLT